VKASRIFLALAFIGFAPLPAYAQQQSTSPTPVATTTPPLLQRIKMVTVAAPDVAVIESIYTTSLDFKVREKGQVSDALAKSWGAPKVANKPYVLLSNDANPDVYIRAVESGAVPNFKPMTTWGWNSFELVVDDIHAMHEKLKATSFTILGTPIPLKSSPSIFTIQVTGPANEVFYFASETGDRSKSSLPNPGGLVGRPFIVILSSPDITVTRDWYADLFSMTKASIRSSGGKVVPRALGLPDGSSLPISLLSLAEPGNRIQLDGYLDHGFGARKRPEGELPPGNAIVSFSVKSIDPFKGKSITSPITVDGKALAGVRAVTLVGPSGELIELIEEQRP